MSSPQKQQPQPPLDFEFDSSSKGLLRYIDQMLMEDDDIDDNARVLEASSDFQDKLTSFYELLDSSKRIMGTNDDKNDCKQEAHEQTMTEKLVVVPMEEFDDDVCNVYTLGGREMEFTACFADLKIADSNQKLSAGKSMKGIRNWRGKKHKGAASVEAIDIKHIIMNCAQALAADDHRAATEFLRQIRRHSTPQGDGNERLAHYFANGLEARLAGTGNNPSIESPITERSTASDYLKVYCVSLTAFGIRKASNFASNKLIATRSAKATRVHVVDFGISYGFQWPLFIRSLAGREGGPPKLRITGIDYPQSGGKIEEAGRRLAYYAEAFAVPFEYNGLARNWESIKVEDLKIEEGEFVAVNCLYGCKNLADYRGDLESSKSMVLEVIKRINPDIFVHGIVNGAYGVPIFFQRFREALYHFSALFDMLETVVPRERVERMVIERDMFGCEIMNVVACEGSERVERPETYKQWHVRHLKAGFKQLRFQRQLIDTAMRKVGNCYDGDFIVDENNKWLLLSWKGRITHAISCWQPSPRRN